MKKVVKITENSRLKEILDEKGAEEILAKHNVPCVGCPMAKFEIQNLTLGQVCKIYGIDINKLLKELNPVVKI